MSKQDNAHKIALEFVTEKRKWMVRPDSNNTYQAFPAVLSEIRIFQNDEGTLVFESHADFLQWAEENKPVWTYPETVEDLTPKIESALNGTLVSNDTIIAQEVVSKNRKWVVRPVVFTAEPILCDEIGNEPGTLIFDSHADFIKWIQNRQPILTDATELEYQIAIINAALNT